MHCLYVERRNKGTAHKKIKIHRPSPIKPIRTHVTRFPAIEKAVLIWFICSCGLARKADIGKEGGPYFSTFCFLMVSVNRNVFFNQLCNLTSSCRTAV
jgi:hypothetical protein